MRPEQKGTDMFYTVEWKIDLDGETAEEVARRALEIQRDPESIATCFRVVRSDGAVSDIDLYHEEEEG